jgi:hypothetical protein
MAAEEMVRGAQAELSRRDDPPEALELILRVLDGRKSVGTMVQREGTSGLSERETVTLGKLRENTQVRVAAPT